MESKTASGASFKHMLPMISVKINGIIYYSYHPITVYVERDFDVTTDIIDVIRDEECHVVKVSKRGSVFVNKDNPLATAGR